MKTLTLSASLRAIAAVAILAAVTPNAHAQGKPAKPAAGKPGAPGKHMTPEQMAQRDLDRLQKVIGKPVTAAQKSALMAAFATRRAEQKASTDKFNAAAAKALGMSVDDLKKKYKAAADADKAAMMAKMAAGGAAPAPKK